MKNRSKLKRIATVEVRLSSEYISVIDINVANCQAGCGGASLVFREEQECHRYEYRHRRRIEHIEGEPLHDGDHGEVHW